MVITQTDLAKKCKVTQQSISNWKNGIRCPGSYAREKLLQLIIDAKLNKDFYVIRNVSLFKRRSRKLPANLPDDVANFALKLSSYSKKKRTEVIAVADFLLGRK